MKSLIKKYNKIILGILLGATAGFLYWKFVGCSTGSCMITSKPINSTLYGAMAGGFLFSALFEKENSKK